ncbi:MAG: 4Fe-4S dicluster domain-containing protein [Candidatus Omnitrophota bacterium]|nr:4Fe-4S dicluster domain-containing protein [Candidatus Omnitrophota bacterium]
MEEKNQIEESVAVLEKKSFSRKDFLKFTLATGAALVAGELPKPVMAKQKDAKPKKRYGMVIDLKKCIGCRSCAVACKAENHTPPGVSYMVVMEEETGEYPNVKRTFIPRPCMHCEHTSCTLVCPTKATYIRPEDGIVVVDYDKCIGCRYCITACPYGARAFDYGHNYSDSPYTEQPSPEYAEYRPRKKNKSPIGNARKCTFCIHRVKKGLKPACVESCVGKTLHFGDLNDPNSEVYKLLHQHNRSYMRLKEELGNEPSVYYLNI